MQSTKKAPSPTFMIRLVAPHIRPWDVPARSLFHIVIAIQRMIEHTEPEIGEGEEPTEEEVTRPEASIQLLNVISRSAAYAVAARDPSTALRILKATGEFLACPEKADWDAPTLSSVNEISRAAKSIGCEVEIRSPEKHGRVIAKITPQSYEEISSAALVSAQSSVYGYLERVGGATQPHCGLRIATQSARMVICHVATEDLVRKLGPYVYTNVRVSGEVTWLKRNWNVKTINVQAFEPVKTGSIRDTLNQIYEAGGKAWDDVDDPEALIKGLR